MSGVRAQGLSDQIAFRNSAMDQVIAAHAAFAELGIGGRATGGDDHRREFPGEQVIGVVEPSAQHGGGTPRIFRSPENHDRFSWVELLLVGFANNAQTGDHYEEKYDEHARRRDPQQPVASKAFVQFHHPWAKKVEISLAGIAPSRITRQRSSVLLRSTMVDATSRGEVPPSTMMPMRSWS